MLRLTFVAGLAALFALPAAAQTAAPDLKGTWKGDSESVVWGGGNPHHAAKPPTRRSFAAYRSRS
jgi:hypothetical protein